MGNEWKETTLGRIALGADGAVDGPFGSNLPASCYTPTGIPIIRGSNLTLGPSRFKSGDFVYTSEDMFQKLRRSECLPGDIIFTKKGTLGQTGIVPCDKKYDKYLLSSNQMRLRIDSELADSEFVYYYVSSEASLEKIKRESEATGVPKINLEYLRNFPIRLPTLNVQKKTVNILKSLDNKITLNRQLNQTLEQMAQALFKSWFVDFDPVIDNALAAGNAIPDDLQDRALLRQGIRQLQLALSTQKQGDHKPLPEAPAAGLPKELRKLFPSEFELTESLGWVPKGWGVSRLDGILELAYGKSLSKTEREEGLVPVYGSGGITGYHNQSIVDGPGIIVGRKGTVGSLYWEPQAFFPIDTVFYVKPFDGISLEYCFLLLQTLGLEDMNTDAAVPGLNRNNAYRLEFSLPCKDVLAQFTFITKSFREKLDRNNFQINSLVSLRDTLLPKLISGELRIPEAQAQLEAVLG